MKMENAVYHSDSLILLERLPSESVQLVYFDPPWLTRRHHDDTLGVDVAGYFDFLNIRIQHVHRVLRHHGNFFIHLESEIAAYIRVLLDRVFEPENFRDQIIIPKHFTPQMRSGPTYEVILFYSKSSESTLHPPTRPLTKEEKSHYNLKDDRGPYRLVSLISSKTDPNLRYEWRGIVPPTGRSWRYSMERMLQLEEQGLISFNLSQKLPSQKVYLDEKATSRIGSIWADIPAFLPQSERTGYETQQTTQLLDRIIRMGTNEYDNVLDPFCGSGTTLVAAHSANRRWIGCDITHQAYDLSVRRLENTFALKAEQDFEVGTDDQIMRTYHKVHHVVPPSTTVFDRVFAESIVEKPRVIPLVITEGKTDWKHLKAALSRLKAAGYYPPDYEIDFLESENLKRGDPWLRQMCKNYSATPQPVPTIFIFDRDIPSTLKEFSDRPKEFKGWGNNVFSFALPVPLHRRETPDICIEHYYKDDEIQRIDTNGRRLFLSSEFHKESGRHTSETLICLELNRIRKGSSIIDDHVFDESNRNVALSKNDFADYVMGGVENFNDFDVFEFTKVFEIVSAIVEHVES